MIFYNFHGKVYDLSTFIEIKDISPTDVILNKYKNYYTYNELKDFFGECYADYMQYFEIIFNFLNNVFFKIYSIIPDIDVFAELFSNFISGELLLKVNNSIMKINQLIDNSIKTFLEYNYQVRNLSENYQSIITYPDFFNYKENYKTFRLSNSFVAKGTDEILQYINTEDEIYELDVKSADLLFLIFISYLLNNEPNILKIALNNNNIYDTIITDNVSHAEKKKILLSSIYSIKHGNISENQFNILKRLNFTELYDNLYKNNKFYLPNGFIRDSKYKLALYGQTLTSIFANRFMLLSLKEYLGNNGVILYTKYDSIVFTIKNNFIFDRNKYFISIAGNYIKCGDNELYLNKKMELLFNKFIKNNYVISKIK